MTKPSRRAQQQELQEEEQGTGSPVKLLPQSQSSPSSPFITRQLNNGTAIVT
jgi:hypothetical protein